MFLHGHIKLGNLESTVKNVKLCLNWRQRKLPVQWLTSNLGYGVEEEGRECFHPYVDEFQFMSNHSQLL